MKYYNAGIVSQSLWYEEFNLYLNYLNQGKTYSEVKNLSDQKNIFQASSTNRAQRMSRALTNRIIAIPQEVREIYFQLDVTNQKLVDFLGIMLTNRLLREFMYEVYRDELILGDRKLEDAEIQAFLTRKQEENAQVASWQEATIHHLKSTIKSLLRETGLVKKNQRKNSDDVTPIMLDIFLIQSLKAAHLDYELSTLEGS
ncbi:DUF1819 family protein [Bombilactobacillus bombi]|uniref:DUF1819 family protein n=1 Tax=Bombilactobacillus bombi TaxID=1303590 RepID=UPI000E57DB39|nr:DUF1819 family protein [Bombilactobacillus bombi]AXX64253.1 DUF1819 family protein [Bombilactobacillus bombi]